MYICKPIYVYIYVNIFNKQSHNLQAKVTDVIDGTDPHEMVETLLDRRDSDGCNTRFSIAHLAAKKGHVAVLDYLFNGNQKITHHLKQSLARAKSRNGNTPLHEACFLVAMPPTDFPAT